MRANQQVGSSSEYKHYLKMKRDMDSGVLPKAFHQGVLELDERYKAVTYTPPHFLVTCWGAFNEIRITKAFENPINHADIAAYMHVMRLELLPSEVTQILVWDQLWYKYYNQYHSR